MKPTRRIMCPDCGKQKMLFETEKKAQGFIKWNAEDIPHGEDLRAYYCPSCCGWHISHQKYRASYDKSTERLIGAYKRVKNSLNKIDILIHYDAYQKKLHELDEKANEVYNDMPDEIKSNTSKHIVKKFLDKYFEGNGIKDEGGRLRTLVYKIWKKKNTKELLK